MYMLMSGDIQGDFKGEKAFVREAVRCGNGCHISIPRYYKGRKVLVVILEEDKKGGT
jgi:putative transposon-encoded protein